MRLKPRTKERRASTQSRSADPAGGSLRMRCANASNFFKEVDPTARPAEMTDSHGEDLGPQHSVTEPKGRLLSRMAGPPFLSDTVYGPRQWGRTNVRTHCLRLFCLHLPLHLLLQGRLSRHQTRSVHTYVVLRRLGSQPDHRSLCLNSLLARAVFPRSVPTFALISHAIIDDATLLTCT